MRRNFIIRNRICENPFMVVAGFGESTGIVLIIGRKRGRWVAGRLFGFRFRFVSMLFLGLGAYRSSREQHTIAGRIAVVTLVGRGSHAE